MWRSWRREMEPGVWAGCLLWTGGCKDGLGDRRLAVRVT